MDAQTFLDNFSTIADAPGGVQRLRDLVLRLAVSGQLVEQTDSDDPASVGIEAVRAEKGETLADSIRGGASVPRVPGPDERAEELPSGWEWARLDDTGEYINGLAFKNSDWKRSGIPIIRIQNLTNPGVPFNFADGPFPEDRMAHDGDILVSWSATLNAFRWNRGDAVVNQHIFKVVPDYRVVTADYLFHLLRHCIRAMAESEAAHGLVMKHINRGPFLSHIVALPPRDEQGRIVAKVDELLGLCDELEVRQERRHRATTRFRGSALHALTEAETLDDLRHAWERVNSSWTDLTSHSTSSGDLRTAILSAALTGHVTVGPSDQTWARCTLGEQITLQRGFDITKKEQRPGPYPVVSSGGVLSHHAEAACLGPGVVIGRKGSVGRVHWVPENYWPHDTTLWVKDFHGNDPEYVYWFLRGFPLLDYESSTANPSLNRNRLHPVEISWPDAGLQADLVKTIRHLFAICDRVEAAINRRQSIAVDFSESLLQA